MTWRAHPEQRNFLGEISRRWGGAPGGQSLQSNLDIVRVLGLAPATNRDWQV